MIKIMFVCHGNICRSPMAEFIFKDLLKKEGLKDKFFVSSSATSTEEIYNGVGNLVYPPAKEELNLHKISCEGKRAVQLRRADSDDYDYFIGMDSYNINNMKRMLNSNAHSKIYKLLDFTKNSRDVSDPWYTRDFKKCYNDIYEGCIAFLDYIKKAHAI